MGDEQREQDGAYQYTKNDHERGDGTDFEVEELMSNHFHAYEAEQQTQTVAQQPEEIGDIAEQEEEGTQAHDGEDVGEEDDVGVGGNGEYGRNAIDGKDNVGELDD